MIIVNLIIGVLLVFSALFGKGEWRFGTFNRHAPMPSRYGRLMWLGIGLAFILSSWDQLFRGWTSHLFMKVGATCLAATLCGMGVGIIVSHVRYYRRRTEPRISRAYAMFQCALGGLFVAGGSFVAIAVWILPISA